MIEIRNLTVQFGGVKPLNDLNVTLDGSVVGVVGPNGAGKTTLLNVLSGFVVPVSGTVTVDGTDVLAMAPFARSRWGVRRTFQTEQVVDSISVRDNVMVMLDAIKMSTSAKREAVDRALELTGLTGVASASGGSAGAGSTMGLNNYQRRSVEIARAIVGSPKVIMMDEPAAGLSEGESSAFRDLVLSLPSATGATVVLIDHDVSLIASVCDRTAVLDFGRLITYGPTLEVLDNPDVKAAYLGVVDESDDDSILGEENP
jgi:branched-chain amino acid transport system ATP-binding protein